MASRLIGVARSEHFPLHLLLLSLRPSPPLPTQTHPKSSPPISRRISVPTRARISLRADLPPIEPHLRRSPKHSQFDRLWLRRRQRRRRSRRRRRTRVRRDAAAHVRHRDRDERRFFVRRSRSLPDGGKANNERRSSSQHAFDQRRR